MSAIFSASGISIVFRSLICSSRHHSSPDMPQQSCTAFSSPYFIQSTKARCPTIRRRGCQCNSSTPQPNPSPFSASTQSQLPPLQSSPAARRAPRVFVRQHIDENGSRLLQTAVTTFQRGPPEKKQTLYIHSLLHIGDRSYYAGLQQATCALTSRGGLVLFELLTSSANLTSETLPRVKVRPFATSAARASARHLRAVTQSDALDVSAWGWVHADGTTTTSQIRLPSVRELLTVCLGAFAAAFLPGPEIWFATGSVLMGRAAIGRTTAVAALRGSIVMARRAAFAARAEASCRQVRGAGADGGRNEIAWLRTRTALEQCEEAALVFGAWHSGAFVRRAEAEGWQFVDVAWRTSLVVTDNEERETIVWREVVVAVVAVTALLVYAGVDWMWLVERMVAAVVRADARDGLAAEVTLYGVRHAAPFVAFWRWFSVWGDE